VSPSKSIAQSACHNHSGILRESSRSNWQSSPSQLPYPFPIMNPRTGKFWPNFSPQSAQSDAPTARGIIIVKDGYPTAHGPWDLPGECFLNRDPASAGSLAVFQVSRVATCGGIDHGQQQRANRGNPGNLGHENRTTTEIYLHSISGAARQAMATYESARGNSHTDSHTN
jgi:hypothetical protein